MKIVLKRIVEQTIEVSGGDTVKSLKRMLMDKKGIPPCLQTLQLNGEDLEDGRTLADCGVTEGASIEVHQASGCDGGGCIQIFFKLPDGEKIPLGAHTFDMIHQIKEKIAAKLKMSVSEYHIVFSGEALESHVSLAECDVVNQSVLLVVPRKMANITIKRIDGEPIELRVDEYDTVKKIKEQLFDITGIPLSMQNIICGDKLLQDNSYLKKYNLAHDSIVWLVRNHSCSDCKKMSITVSNHTDYYDPEIQLKLNSCDSVRSVMNMARQKLVIKPDGFLKFNGEYLDESRTLAECRVSDGDTVYIERGNEMRINVKTVTGRTMTFDVQRSTTIEQVKRIIRKAQGVQTSEPNLIFAGRQLENGETLANYNIRNKNTLHSVLRQCGC